ncbi:BETA-GALACTOSIDASE 7 [Salix purpurea]|uniref:beta-galactosidase n=1 Tax=Salix purpurea TaxID=77065 RepID=A0A9Q0YX93_SALPP|nr:BETA-GALACTOSIDASE 7 [Salix purpurea]
MSPPGILALIIVSFCAISSLCATATQVTYDNRAIIIDGKHRVLVSGSIHYPRSTTQMWPDLMKKSREGGLDAIETYVFWNAHEPARRQYDFSGNLDLIRFLKTIQEEGLYAVLRIGPYVCAEWNYGGFPVWLHNMPGIQMRTDNDVFKNEMQNFTTLIVDMVKKEKTFLHRKEIENEYGNVMSSYGDEGKAYMNWCANMAQSLDIGVPWIMCQQNDAPEPIISTCNGWYCDQYQPPRSNIPKMWTENWTGCLGGTFQNYYMYHGGTNFGRSAGGPYITTSYDYDAPLDEYGNLNQPKWGHLKQLHDLLHSMEDILTTGNVSYVDLGDSAFGTIYSKEGGSSCFLANVDSGNDKTINFQGMNYTVPAWSVSILPDCQNVAYNTAKVSTQTSVMVKKANVAEEEPNSLKWSWRPEMNEKTILLGKGDVTTDQILDQKEAANDLSDYLFYMTSLDLKKDDPVWSHNMTLRVKSSGQILHAFVNGELIGSQWAKNGGERFVFEQNVKLNHKKNTISLLSATVGLTNYGAFFDTAPSGITGPVELIGYRGDDETIVKDLSSQKWSYKTGLEGLNQKLYSSPSLKWQQDSFPVNRTLTWYKSSFKAPLGTDPVVVDLLGMGKGLAWVNGNSIGRYWPSFIAEGDCKLEPCDYRGSYDSNKCLSNCGRPSQRWYHVPRSFLNGNGDNTLVLFEEFGGNPSSVNFQTVAVGSACINAEENRKIELSCQGRQISAVKFASFGNPQGSCGSFVKGYCEGSKDASSVVEKACVGQESCTVDVSEDTFGSTTCGDDVIKTLAVEAIC